MCQQQSPENFSGFHHAVDTDHHQLSFTVTELTEQLSLRKPPSAVSRVKTTGKARMSPLNITAEIKAPRLRLIETQKNQSSLICGKHHSPAPAQGLPR